MDLIARPSRVAVRGLLGAVAGFAAMWLIGVPVILLLQTVVETSCLDLCTDGICQLVCVEVLPWWAISAALVIAVAAGLAAAVATGRLTRRMGASVTRRSAPAAS